MSKQQFIIKDWANNLIKLPGRPYIFDSFDDAEAVLSEELDESYVSDRGEYYIEEIDGF